MYIITLKRNGETGYSYKKRIKISLVNLLHNTLTYILYRKEDANTAFRHPLHPYTAWKTLNYLSTEAENFPLENNNFVIMAIYSLRRPTNNTNIREFWS